MYAVIDIETTGGKYNEESITEIAIYKYDGSDVVDKFVSLVNPERDIQPFVVRLTGINSKMLVNAPKFYEIAKKVNEITTDCVVVAHNANFDYRILKEEYRRLGFDYIRNSMCTVELSKNLLPEEASYSLGKLCKSLGIPMTARHRAEGDTVATVELFKLLQTKDVKKTILLEHIKGEKDKPKCKLTQKLSKLVDELPRKSGVFYLISKEKKIIYIGKASNINKQCNKLFLRTSEKAKLLHEKVNSVSFDCTGNKLLADIKYYTEIKAHNLKFQIKSNKHISTVVFEKKNAVLVYKGRETYEKALILIEDDIVKGYAYSKLTTDSVNISALKKKMVEIDDNLISRGLIQKTIESKYPPQMIEFENE